MAAQIHKTCKAVGIPHISAAQPTNGVRSPPRTLRQRIRLLVQRLQRASGIIEVQNVPVADPSVGPADRARLAQSDAMPPAPYRQGNGGIRLRHIHDVPHNAQAAITAVEGDAELLIIELQRFRLARAVHRQHNAQALMW